MRVISPIFFPGHFKCRAPVKSRQKSVPQIRASFTKDARAWNARRYAMFTRGRSNYIVCVCVSYQGLSCKILQQIQQSRLEKIWISHWSKCNCEMEQKSREAGAGWHAWRQKPWFRSKILSSAGLARFHDILGAIGGRTHSQSIRSWSHILLLNTQ